MSYFAGLDVSMKTTFICIVNDRGKIVYQGESETDPTLIAEQIKATGFSIDRAGIESGSLSFWLVKELQKLKVPALCIDARKMATLLSVQINKTDENDARGIADAMRCNLYKEVAQRSELSLQIGTLMGSRRILVNQRTQIKNAVRGFLKTYGIRLETTGEKDFPKKVKEKTILEQHAIAREGIDSLLACYEKSCEEIERLEKKIQELAKDDEDIIRLMTIPGIGIITAMTFKMTIGNPQRFSNPRDVGAYIGMTPRQYSSGEIHRQGKVSKCGSSELRFLLTEAGIVILTRTKKWSKLKAWGLKIMKKHGTKKAAMAVGRKLAIIMHQMLIDKTDFIYGEEKTKKDNVLKKAV